MTMAGSDTLLERAAESLECSSSALRFLISMFTSILAAAFYRRYIFGKNPNLQHSFFTVCGLILLYYADGINAIHSLIVIITVYVVLITIGGTPLSVIVVFTFSMTYLLIAYVITCDDPADVTWTTPHCILTLKVIAITYDLYDGNKPEEERIESEQETAISETPTLLEFLGHSYYVGSVLVGPMVSFKKYKKFVDGELIEKKDLGQDLLPPSVAYALERVKLGFVYFALYAVGRMFFDTDFLATICFNLLPFWKKVCYVMIWGKLAVGKYFSIWLFAETACIFTGLAYNGKDSKGNILWNGCANVRVCKLETATRAYHIIQSFNIHTNHWLATYMYKRFKHLGNKNISMGITLLFAAVWHGYYVGYYLSFAMEAIINTLEKEFTSIFSKSTVVKKAMENLLLKILIIIFLRCYVSFAFAYSLIPFHLLFLSPSYEALKSLYFFWHIVLIPWPLYVPLVKKCLEDE